jgi:hypothetical protein
MRPPRRYSPHANAFGPCATASNLHAAAPTTAAPPPWTAAADRAAWIGSSVRDFHHFISLFPFTVKYWVCIFVSEGNLVFVKNITVVMVWNQRDVDGDGIFGRNMLVQWYFWEVSLVDGISRIRVFVDGISWIFSLIK